MATKPSVLIVGGGAFGTSTAYHLSLRGYDRVTVLDRFDAPSMDSAATDLNKVVRADYPRPLYTRLGMEAMAVWKDPKSIFAGMYRETGWIMAAHSTARGWLESARKTAGEAKREELKYMTADEIKTQWPALTGNFPDWTNIYSPDAGWVGYHVPNNYMLPRLTDTKPQVPSGQARLCMADAARNQ